MTAKSHKEIMIRKPMNYMTRGDKFLWLGLWLFLSFQLFLENVRAKSEKLGSIAMKQVWKLYN